MSPFVSYCLTDVSGSVVAAHDEHRSYYAASTMKVAVLVALARAIDAGTHSWDDEVTVKRTFESQLPGAGSFGIEENDRDDRLPADGNTLSLHDLADAMITRSSNEATNLVMEVVGIPACAEVMDREAGDGCHLERYIGDLAARAIGVSNQVTAYGLARLLRRLVTGRLASPAATRIMTGMLSRQEFPMITLVLPEGTRWGSKSGSVEGIRHDVAFVGDPLSPDLDVLAVCTEGYEDDEAAKTRIGQIAADLLQTPRSERS